MYVCDKDREKRMKCVFCVFFTLTSSSSQISILIGSSCSRVLLFEWVCCIEDVIGWVYNVNDSSQTGLSVLYMILVLNLSLLHSTMA